HMRIQVQDILVLIGVGATFLLGIANLISSYRLGRKTTFINTVTSSRISWIETLRQDISEFCGLAHTWSISPNIQGTPRESEIFQRLDKLRYLIPLRLNPLGNIDKEITRQIREIPDLAVPGKTTELLGALESLTSNTRILLKLEWEKVKRESQHNELDDTRKALSTKRGTIRLLIVASAFIFFIGVWN